MGKPERIILEVALVGLQREAVRDWLRNLEDQIHPDDEDLICRLFPMPVEYPGSVSPDPERAGKGGGAA